MGRYTYNASLVAETLELLNSAYLNWQNMPSGIQKEINKIKNTRYGSELNNVSVTPATLGEIYEGAGYDTVETIISQLNLSNVEYYLSEILDVLGNGIEDLKTITQEIEEYQNAPWWKKAFSTTGLSLLKVGEGILSVGENIYDGGAALVGFFGGLFLGEEFKEDVANHIEKDHVGELSYKLYEEGPLKGIDKYSVFSHTSTAANVLKGVGCAAGYVMVGSVVPGGLVTSTATSFLGGMGSGTQTALQQSEDVTFDQAFFQGVKTGGTAALTTLALGKVGEKLASAAKTANPGTPLTIFDDVVTNAKGVQRITNNLKGTINGLANSKAGVMLAKVASNPTLYNGLVTATGVTVAQVPQNVFTSTAHTVATNKSENDFKSESESKTETAEQTIVEGTITETTMIEDTNAEISSYTEIPSSSNGYRPSVNYKSPSSSVGTLDSIGGNTETNITTPSTESTGGNITTPSIENVPTDSSTIGSSYSSPPPAEQIIGGSTSYHPSTPITPGNTSAPIIDSTISGSDIDYNDIASTDVPKLDTENIISTLGNTTGSITGMTSSGINIPSSSSPILSSGVEKTQSASVIPLTAGIGAAGLAAVGAKTYLDKKENKKDKEEEIEKLETEEWTSEEGTLDIDYNNKESKENDYLTPTDEFAFQEN